VTAKALAIVGLLLQLGAAVYFLRASRPLRHEALAEAALFVGVGITILGLILN
jgi:hypothetical protein